MVSILVMTAPARLGLAGFETKVCELVNSLSEKIFTSSPLAKYPLITVLLGKSDSKVAVSPADELSRRKLASRSESIAEAHATFIQLGF